MGVVESLRTLTDPAEIPDLVSFWTFERPGKRFTAVAGEAYVLESQSGTLDVADDSDCPWTEKPFPGSAIRLLEGDYLTIPSVAISLAPEVRRRDSSTAWTAPSAERQS